MGFGAIGVGAFWFFGVGLSIETQKNNRGKNLCLAPLIKLNLDQDY